MIQESSDYPANGMTAESIEQLLDVHLDRVLNRRDTRHVFFRVLDFCNNFFFGFFVALFIWVYPFLELAQIINGAIQQACGAK